jgi:transcriptional regulator with XRE-family HTH domain
MPFSGERLKQARLRSGLSQTELAGRLGVVQQQVNRWEQQRTLPSPDTLARMAQILEATTDWLLELVEQPTEHLTEQDLSEDERRLVLMYRHGQLPDLIRRLVTELAEGYVQKDPVVDGTRKADVPPQDVAASR